MNKPTRERRKKNPAAKTEFNRKTFWLGQTESAPAAAVRTAQVEKIFRHNEALLRDHLIYDEQVLMGVAHLSLAIDWARRQSGPVPLCLKRATFSNAVMLRAGEAAQVTLSAEQKGDQYLAASRYRLDSRAPEKEAASFQIETAAQTKWNDKGMDPAAYFSGVAATGARQWAGDVFYRHPQQRCYGPSLLSVERVVELKPGVVMGRIWLSAEMRAAATDYEIHPSVFDACHVVSSFALDGEPALNHRVPLLIKNITLAAQVDAQMLHTCYCRVEKIRMNDQIAEMNLRLYDANGRAVAELEGFTTKTVSGKAAIFGAESSQSGADLEKRIQHYLREKIAPVIRKAPKEVPLQRNFMDLGLESTNMIGAVRDIEKEIGLELYPTLFFEYQNIAALAGYFCAENAAEFSAYFNSGAEEVSVPAATRRELFAPLPPDRTGVRADSIAIIGMSGRLAQSANLREFWQHLREGRDLIEEVPQDHWDYRPWFDNDRDAANKTYAKWGSFIRDLDKFDPGFFGISPRQADWMDPQLRLLLQCAQETFEDAGIINRIHGSRTGVYVGSCFQEYWDEIVRAQIPFVDYQAHSAALSSLSGTVSYMFDLQGGSIPLDNACASSLTALHLGCQAIKNGECEQALVAGVNLLLSPLHYVYFSRLQALSPSGRCHTFDRKADGYVPGEGVVAVLIKPLQAALADGDNIHAVIRGTAINHVGRSNNPYSPRPELQTKLLLDAWQKAEIDPRRLTYLEAHGTGTPLGDPIEINALKAAFKPHTRDRGFCAIGSAKAHIGHLEGAAGLASLVKVVLMMQHRTIPRMPNFEALNPYIKLDDSPFYVNTERVEWHSENGPLLAGVSSFGMTGNNAHMVLEAYATVSRSQPLHSYLVPLSAKSEPQLKRYAEKFHAYLAADPSVNLTDLAYTMQAGRQAFAHRAMFLAQTREQLQERLQNFMAAGAAETNAGFVYGACTSEPEPEELFASVENYRNSIARWFRDDHLKLAQHWAQGLAIDWDALYAAAGLPKPQRIPLPTYPFAQQRYWMKAENAVPPPPVSVPPARTTGQTAAAESALRPARVDRAQYALRLQGDAFFLRDHKVRAQKVLPGVAYLETARAAVEMETGQPVTALNGVVWVRPLAVDDVAKEAAIHLSPADGKLNFTVSTGTEPSTPHCQGSAVTAKAIDRPPALDLEHIRKGCRSRAETESIYARFQQQGLEYGESFRAIDHLDYGDSQALTFIQLPAHLAAETHGCLLHPSIADAALQSILGLTLGAEKHSDTAVTLLPFSVRRIDFHAPTPARAYAYARYTEGTDSSGALLQYDVSIADENGNVCVVFNGFTCRALREREAAVETAPATRPQTSPELAAEENLARWVDETLQGFVSDILKVERDYISLDEEMSAYGMDSITLTELGNITGRHFDIDISPTVFFEHHTLELFRDHLIDTFRPALLRAFSGAAPEQRTQAEHSPAPVAQTAPANSAAIAAGLPAPAPTPAGGVAIIGISGRFPMAADVDAYWENLQQGRDCIAEVPASRWNWQEFYGDAQREGNRTRVKWGGFIDDIECFDPLFFGIAPTEAESMDPQQRLLLETVWHAIEDAGYRSRALWGSDTGVFIGTANTGYPTRAMGAPLEGYSSTAMVPSIGPARVSFLLNLHGPCEPIETACSSSLVALHRAVHAVVDGACGLALAGGVNTLVDPRVHISFSKAGMLCEDGRCKTFSSAANGYVRGEGVGIVLLKRLDRALADGDHIYALIRGSSENHGGRVNSLTAPNSAAQTTLLLAAYRQADIDVGTVGYIEAHGTGTALGDPVEVNALRQAFKVLSEERGSAPGRAYCGLGSVKSNIGHLELAAGIAGVIKVLLAFKHGELPPTLHAEELNPYLQLEESPFYVVRARTPWVRPRDAGGRELPRRAGVSSFGFGGVNAHVVLEEYRAESEAVETVCDKFNSGVFAVPLSAKSAGRLRDYAAALLRFIETREIELAALAYTLQTGRDEMEYRLALVVANAGELRLALQAFLDGRAADNIYQNRAAGSVAENMAEWLQQADRHRLAAAWSKGAAVDWEQLYGALKPRRLSLPTYPFARERYWLPYRAPAAAPATASDPRAEIVLAAPQWRRTALPAQGSASAPVPVLLLGASAQAAAALERQPDIRLRHWPAVEAGPLDIFLCGFEWIKAQLSELLEQNTNALVIAPDHYNFSVLAGLVKTALREHSRWRAKVITVAGLSEWDAGAIARIIAWEGRGNSGAVEVRYAGGPADPQRSVKILAEAAQNGNPPPTALKTGGVYWISGGVGGLGKQLARAMLKTGSVTVVLSGRNPIEAETKAELDVFAARHRGTVEYWSADMTDAEAVTAVFENIKARYQKLDGIVHAAGVIRDGALTRKTEADIASVFQPKVEGVLNLDTVSRDEALDFFVLFSSLAAVTGNAGQADYAAANSFLDAFSVHRQQLVANGERRGLTLSINWPLWRNGGMQIDAAAVERLRRVTGLQPLDDGAGLDCLRRALAMGITPLAVMAGEGAAIREYFLAGGDRTAPLPATAAVNGNAELRAATLDYLKTQLAATLKIPARRIDARAEFEKYGIDSVMVLKLTRALAARFGPLPKTLFFEYRTLVDLAAYFASEHTRTMNDILGPAAAARAEEPLPSVPAVFPGRESPPAATGAAADIAIIGLSGQYPQAASLDAFWENLKQGRDCITEIPPGRWDYQRYYHPDKNRKGTLYSKWGGFLEQVDEFDPLFFNISPREAEVLDPQERLFLQCAWQALEDSGYTREHLANNIVGMGNVGVYVGVMYEEYQLYGAAVRNAGAKGEQALSLSGNPSSIANRVSYVCNFRGPSMAVDTMCSSSLTSIHLACASLKAGHCGMALAGGVNLSLHPNKYLLLSQGRFISSRGRCESFGAGGDGYIPGEGVGCAVLKPLAQAEADGDHIYGVIKGTAINHGGKTNGYTVPNPGAQTDVILAALKQAGADPRAVSHIEAHGTGTSLGDPIEIQGLTRAFRSIDENLPAQYCAIGSAKSNIGHCESAAGIAGVTKVLLQLQHKQLVPSIHSQTLNPNIDFSATPFKVQRELSEWQQPVIDGVARPRLAGVSSFGAGGSNAHILIEEYVAAEAPEEKPLLRPQLILLSARSDERLRVYAQQLREFLQTETPNLDDFAYTLQVGREAMEYRLAFLVENIGELEQQLSAYLSAGGDHAGYLGRVNGEAGGILSLQTDTDFDAFVLQLLRKHKLSTLAELWTGGAAVPWFRLYEAPAANGGFHRIPRRLSLPTYPFAREKYWVAAAPARAEWLHPLLGRNTSDFEAQQFSSTFSGDEFFLRDHRVWRRPVLPAAGYLEMARAAAALSAKQPVQSLCDLALAQPVIIEGEPVQVDIRLFPETDGIHFEIVSFKIVSFERGSFEIVSGTAETLHCQGRVLSETIAEPAAVFDIGDLQVQAVTEITAQQLYDLFAQQGLEYGSAFQMIETLSVSENQTALARLNVPAGIGKATDYLLHPSVMDAALQTVAGLLLDKTPAAGETYLPFAIERIDIHRPVSAAVFAWARLQGGHNADEVNGKTFDIDLLDENGRGCVAVRGFNLRLHTRHDREAAAAEVLLATHRWRERAAEPVAASASASALLIGLEGIAPAAFDAPLSNSLYALPAGESAEDIFVRVFDWIKPKLTQANTAPHPLLLFAPDTYAFAALSGLLRTANRENPHVSGRLVLLAPAAVTDVATATEMIMRECAIPVSAGVEEVRYSAGRRREVRLLEELAAGPATAGAENPPPLKAGGVYWITGGLGGLGRLFARYLARCAAPGENLTLVLSGRSVPDESGTGFLRELNAGAVRAEYVCVDTADKNAVLAAADSIRTRFGAINGVIHSAGVIRDALIQNKTEMEIRAVFDAKVKGIEHIDAATAGDPLDFMVLFSSIAASLGSVGQADYAGANCVLNAFAEHRNQRVGAGERCGLAVSIEWPLWREGGMQVDAKTAQRITRNSGLVPLDTENGLAAFARILANGWSPALVLQGDSERIREKVLAVAPLPGDGEKEKTAQRRPDISAGAESSALKESCVEYLKGHLSRVLKLPAYKIDEQTSMEKYGIDSVMVLEITDELEQHFGPLPKTLLFEYRSIERLADYLLATCHTELTRLLAVGERAPAVAAAPVESGPVMSKRIPKRRRGSRSRFAAAASLPPAASAAGREQSIAVIGLSGRYPQAETLQAFWENLQQGRDCITEIPPERWDYQRYYHPDKNRKGTLYSKWGGFLEQVDEFDPQFFNISPREAEVLDPQERLFLQCAWQALEDSGYTREHLANNTVGMGNVGVYVGVMYEEYQLYGAAVRNAGAKGEQALSLSGNPSSIANRVSYIGNFRGPSMAVDTMCSSSLTSIHLACESLKAGHCGMALAGGVNLSLHPNKYLLLSQGRFISSRGRCESFGAGGDGYIPGEGVGCAVLKPLAQAEADGDHIYGVIKGTAINHGGKTNGYTVPNPGAQTEVILAALKQAGADPRAVSYIEAHGTGTSLGDPIEIQGLTRAFRSIDENLPAQYCAIGSAKSNIGHCESAAGIAGVTKVLLQLQHKQLVPSIHSQTLNPNIDFSATPFKVQRELSEWQQPVIDGVARPRLAGVSSFGAGGSNAHILIEEYVAAEAPEEKPLLRPQLILLSARSDERLRVYAQQLREFLQTETPNLDDFAYTLQVGREAMKERLAFPADSTEDVITRLKEFLAGKNLNIFLGRVSDERDTVDLFNTDADLRRTVAGWLREKRLSKLAELWVKGLKPDWTGLYDSLPPRRISLPTYPFRRDSYWAPGKPPAAAPAEKDSGRKPSAKPLFAPLPPAASERWVERPLPENQAQWAQKLSAQAGREALVIIEDAAHCSAIGALFERLDKTLAQPLLRLNWLLLAEAADAENMPRIHPRDRSGLADFVERLDTGNRLPQVVFYIAETTHWDAFLHLADRLDAKASQNDSRRFVVYSATDADKGGTETAAGRPRCKFIRLDAGVGAAQRIVVAINEWLWDEHRTGWVNYAGGNRRVLETDIAPAAKSDVYFLNKHWRQKSAVPAGVNNSGECLVLLNRENRHLIPALRDGALSGRLLFACGETLDDSDCMPLPLDRPDAMPEATARLLERHPGIDAVIDLSDLFYADSDATRLYGDSATPGRIALYQTLAGRFTELSILHFTCGLQTFDCRAPNLAGARIIGLIRMLSAEYRHLHSKSIDLDTDAKSVESLPAIVRRECGAELEETEICYRGGNRFAPCLQETPCSEALTEQRRKRDLPVDGQGVYVISGGTSGVGLEIARYLAARGAGELVLMGITPLPPQAQWRAAIDNAATPDSLRNKLAALATLQREGARLSFYTGELTDAAELSRYFQAIRARGGRIRGVVHSAGALLRMRAADFAFVKKTAADFHASLAPKVDGLNTLAEVLGGDALQYFVVFSSSAGRVPAFMRGMSDYATANTYLDHFVAFQRAQGKSFFRSIAWTGWRDAGSHTLAGPNPAAENAGRYGLLFNDNTQGRELFEHALLQTGGDGVLWPTLLNREIFQAQCPRLLFARAAPAPAGAAPEKDGGRQFQSLIEKIVREGRAAAEKLLASLDLETLSDAQVDQLFHHLREEEPEEIEQPLREREQVNPEGTSLAAIKALLKQELTAVLKLDGQWVTEHESFQNYGLDSITGTQLAMAVERKLSFDIPPVWLIEYPSIDELGRKLVEEQQTLERSNP